MHPDRVLGVVRTGGIEATLAAEQPGQRHAIHTDQRRETRDAPALPPSSMRSTWLTSGPPARARAIPHPPPPVPASRAPDAPLATTTTSYPSSTPSATSRHAARRTRRALLRQHRVADSPARNERRRPGSGREKHYHPFSVQICLDRRTAVRAAARARRRPRGQPRPALRAAPGKDRRGPPSCASGHGSRASSRGGGCSVGTFAWTSGSSSSSRSNGRPFGGSRSIAEGSGAGRSASLRPQAV